MPFHAHTCADGTITCHSHDEDLPHVHGTTAHVPHDAKDVTSSWHEHTFDGSTRIRHRHASGHASHQHHGEETLDDVTLLPMQPTWSRILFPQWTTCHAWYDIWPLHHMRPSHAKAHFNTSGVDDAWPGALTILTQSFKIGIGVVAWIYRDGDKDKFYNATLIGIVAVSAIIFACWLVIWGRRSIVNVLLTLSNYVLYVNGWTLSVIVLYEKLEAVYNIPRYLGLIPVLVPPVYVTTRTVLFFPSVKRRQRFLLAALSNRSVPLELNFYVVGPKDTWLSHGFLTMLNTYAMVSTVVAKAVVFGLQSPTALAFVAHSVHSLSVWWASLYAIRCRQIALDCYKATEEEFKNATPDADKYGAAQTPSAI